MAAAMKMDELLVSWLDRDDVYESVLEWINSYHVAETLKQQNQQQSQQYQQVQQYQVDEIEKQVKELSITTTTSNNNNDSNTKGITVGDKTESELLGGDDGTIGTGGTTTTTQSTTTSSFIPPFYPIGQQYPRQRIIRTNNSKNKGSKNGSVDTNTDTNNNNNNNNTTITTTGGRNYFNKKNNALHNKHNNNNNSPPERVYTQYDTWDPIMISTDEGANVQLKVGGATSKNKKKERKKVSTGAPDVGTSSNPLIILSHSSSHSFSDENQHPLVSQNNNNSTTTSVSDDNDSEDDDTSDDDDLTITNKDDDDSNNNSNSTTLQYLQSSYPGGLGLGNNNINNNNNTGDPTMLLPYKCARDATIALYNEILGVGNHINRKRNSSIDKQQQNNDPNNNTTNNNNKLTVDQLTRITKEVCRFPSYFNVPLYNRIIELWNLQTKKKKNKTTTTSTTTAVDNNNKTKNQKEKTPTPINNNDPTKLETEVDDMMIMDDDISLTSGGGHGDGGNSGSVSSSSIVVVDGITLEMFEYYFRTEMEPFDAYERFFRLVRQISNDNFIVKDDFLPFIKALLTDHPGLEFLSSHGEFQEKYATTVITRIFYSVNKCHTGRITSRQVRRSDLYDIFIQVDEEEDINKVTKYFSYEHFYVLYCRFWELDHDRDYKITREDLLKYGDHSLSHMIVDRIFDAAPRPFIESTNQHHNNNPTTVIAAVVEGGGDGMSGSTPESNVDGIISTELVPSTATPATTTTQKSTSRDYLSYEDFIYFMLSEEDKSNEVAVKYWFACVDVDGDNKLNNMEMRSFYAVQLHRMQCMGHEIVPFDDMLCQMMDMIKPKHHDYLIVDDFLQPECCQVSGALFDALFNLNKYLLFEQRDPFVERQKREDEFDCDWDRFACIDYNRLAMEEEAREEEAMEIDWVTVDDEEDDEHNNNQNQQQQQNQSESLEPPSLSEQQNQQSDNHTMQQGMDDDDDPDAFTSKP